jgi:hypothetical protein
VKMVIRAEGEGERHGANQRQTQSLSTIFTHALRESEEPPLLYIRAPPCGGRRVPEPEFSDCPRRLPGTWCTRGTVRDSGVRRQRKYDSRVNSDSGVTIGTAAAGAVGRAGERGATAATLRLLPALLTTLTGGGLVAVGGTLSGLAAGDTVGGAGGAGTGRATGPGVLTRATAVVDLGLGPAVATRTRLRGVAHAGPVAAAAGTRVTVVVATAVRVVVPVVGLGVPGGGLTVGAVEVAGRAVAVVTVIFGVAGAVVDPGLVDGGLGLARGRLRDVLLHPNPVGQVDEDADDGDEQEHPDPREQQEGPEAVAGRGDDQHEREREDRDHPETDQAGLDLRLQGQGEQPDEQDQVSDAEQEHDGVVLPAGGDRGEQQVAVTQEEEQDGGQAAGEGEQVALDEFHGGSFLRREGGCDAR